MSAYPIEEQQGRPESVSAEVTILGAMLLEPLAINDATAKLQAGDFSLDSHRKIYSVMLHLLENGRSVDLITVGEELRSRKHIEAVGGPAYVAGLTEGLPRNLSVENYVRIVKDKSLSRSMMAVADLMMTRCADQSEPALDILNSSEQQLLDLAESGIERDLTGVKSIVEGSFATIDGLYESGKELTGLQTHYTEFDRMTCGLQDSELIIIAARPSMGKTAWAINIAQNAAVKDGKTVAIFSLEMSKESLLRRMLASQALVDSMRIQRGFIGEHDRVKLVNALGALVESKLFIDDTPSITLAEMRAKCRRLKQREGGLDLIVVDYLQLMNGGTRTENRTQEVSVISRGLKALAKQLRVPVVALSQLSRASEQGSKPRKPILSDLRESGSIEQDADVVAFIHRDSYYNKDENGDEDPDLKGKAEIIIAKQRNGPTGSIYLAWMDQYTRFENLEHARVDY